MSKDQRSMLTKRLLKEALIDIIKEGNHKKLSVKTLCEKAGINRTTFYYHYNDSTQILDEIQNEIRIELEAILSELNYGENQDGFYHRLFKFFERNSDICKFILNSNAEALFLESVLDFAYDIVKSKIAQFAACDEDKLKSFFVFVSNGCLGMIRHWLNNGMKESAKEIAEISKSLALNGTRFLLS